MVRLEAAGLGQRRAPADVAVTGGGETGRDAQGDDLAARGKLSGGGEHLAQASLVGDMLVGGQHSDQRIRRALLNVNHAQANRRAGIHAERLGDEILRRDVRRVGAQGGDLVLAGHDEDALRRQQGGQPLDGNLKHGAVFDQGQHLLGPVATAKRPQARPTAARHDQGVQESMMSIPRQVNSSAATHGAIS